MRGRGAVLLAGAALIFAAAAPAEEPPAPAAVTGVIVYRARMALPPDAVVRVRLEAAAEPERPPRRIAEITVPTNGKQVPIPFTLPYDAAGIRPGKRYQVRAWIDSGSQVLFATRAAYPVITKGNPTKVEIEVEPAGTGARRPPRIPAPDVSDLSASAWTLEAAGDKPAKAGAASAEIAFDRGEHRITGSTGCNRFFGTYDAGEGNALKLLPTGQTLMACSGDAAVLERAFLDALRATASYRISGSTLELLDRDGHVLARFAPAGESTAPAH